MTVFHFCVEVEGNSDPTNVGYKNNGKTKKYCQTATTVYIQTKTLI